MPRFQTDEPRRPLGSLPFVGRYATKDSSTLEAVRQGLGFLSANRATAGTL